MAKTKFARILLRLPGNISGTSPPTIQNFIQLRLVVTAMQQIDATIYLAHFLKMAESGANLVNIVYK
jgi:hypothetical protein